jgi:hypothetical protein
MLHLQTGDSHLKQLHNTHMAALTFAVCVNCSVAMPVLDNSAAVASGPDASTLMAFYSVSLATSPVGTAEDKAVWLAKVQGLIAQAPAWLQQKVLASKTRAEFAANLAILQSMQTDTLENGLTAVKRTASAKVSAQGLGRDNEGQSNNLVYTALAPCRIMDTRNASVASGLQGPIAGNSLKQIPGYITAGLNWGQYGGAAASDCGLNSTAGKNISAVAIVITVLDPNFSAYLGVSDSNDLSSVLDHVALNYTARQGLSTMYIVPQISGNAIYFAMPTGLSANIIFDVVGYFATSQAIALECSNQTSRVAGGRYVRAETPACTPGLTVTGGSCVWEGEYSGGDYPTLHASATFFLIGWRCQGTSSSDLNLIATAICCRVPGR